MKIRRARLEDSRKIVNLKKKTFKEINSKDYSKKVVEEYVKKQTVSKISNSIKKHFVFVIEDNGKILGVIGLKDDGIVGSLYVRSDQIGKGYGKKLMNYIENLAKKKDIKKIVLHPTRTAEVFYEKLGYKTKKKLDRWKIGGETIQVKEMWKNLKWKK